MKAPKNTPAPKQMGVAQATAKLHVAVIFAVRGNGARTYLLPQRGLGGLLAAADRLRAEASPRTPKADQGDTR